MKKIWTIAAWLWKRKEFVDFFYDLYEILEDGRVTHTELNYILSKTREIIP